MILSILNTRFNWLTLVWAVLLTTSKHVSDTIPHNSSLATNNVLSIMCTARNEAAVQVQLFIFRYRLDLCLLIWYCYCKCKFKKEYNWTSEKRKVDETKWAVSMRDFRVVCVCVCRKGRRVISQSRCPMNATDVDLVTSRHTHASTDHKVRQSVSSSTLTLHRCTSQF